MKNQGRENVILDMIKGQEQKIAKAQARIAELQAELVELQKPPIDIQGYCGKILYTSDKAAHAARKLINRDLKKNGKDTLKRAYHCQSV